MVVDRLAEEADWASKFEALILKSERLLVGKAADFYEQFRNGGKKIMNFYKFKYR